MAEQEFVLAILFAGMLVAGTLMVLLSPILFKLTQEVTKWKLYGALALILGVMGISVYVVWLALTNFYFFLPFVILVMGLRASSPSILYKSLEDRFWERERLWQVLRVLLAVGFLGYAGYLVYTLLLSLLQEAGLVAAQSSAAILSEQILMAVGGAFVIVRLFARVLPESLRDKPTAWLAAILLSLAFAVMAPYAFPEYDLYYRLSGLAGWLIGFVILWRFSL